MIKVRNSLYETNSSSCHTISINNIDKNKYTIDDLVSILEKNSLYKDITNKNGYRKININIEFCVNPYEGSDADKPLPFIAKTFKEKWEILCTYFYNRYSNYILFDDLKSKYNLDEDIMKLFRSYVLSKKVIIEVLESYYLNISKIFYEGDVFGRIINNVYNYGKSKNPNNVEIVFIRNGDIEEYYGTNLFGNLGVEENGGEEFDHLTEDDILNVLLGNSIIEVSPNLYYD